MQKSRFNSKNTISDRVFFDRKENTYSAFDFIEIASGFLRDNYKGIVDISTEISSFEYIKISEYYLVKLLKRVVEESKLKKLINVNFGCNSDVFSIGMFYNDGTAFDRSFEREIIKLARSAGLEAIRAKSGLCFSKAVFKPTVLTVFTKLLARARLERLFREVFFSQYQP